MCSDSGLNIYPKEKEISLNEMIIIEGYASSQKIINSLSKRKVFLTSKNDKVQLTYKASNVGEMNITQAFFIPLKSLKPNSIYFIEFENQTTEETSLLKVWNKVKKNSEKISFKTRLKKTIQGKYKNIEYKFENTNYIMYGCGPAIYANFKVQNTLKKKNIYKIELFNITSNNKKTYYLPSNIKGVVSIGHGMCSGAFNFNSISKYKIRFTPVNSSGELQKKSNWIHFKNPYKNIKTQW
jgi:hypothetical protein